MDIAGFLKLVIEALNAAAGEYLIGGVIAEEAWGEPRATQDLDLVVKIPIKSINKLSKELEKRDMLIPADIILDSILEDRKELHSRGVMTGKTGSKLQGDKRESFGVCIQRDV